MREIAGVYRLIGIGAGHDDSLVVASLKLPGAVASHESAARRLGFPFVGDGPEVVTVPVRTTHRWPGLRVVESTDLARADCVERGIFTMTGPVRTVIDLASTTRPARLARIVDELLAAKVVDLEALAARHTELARKGKPGIQVMRDLLEARGFEFVPPESQLEVMMLALLDRHGFPPPERQVELHWLSERGGRVDFAYPAARLIIECDGRRWHTRERDFERDRRRDNEAMLAGWRVLRITYDQLVNHEALVVSMVRRALDAQAA